MLSDSCFLKHIGFILPVLKHNAKSAPYDKLYLGLTSMAT
jgi:hypothetical protein